MLEPNPPAPLPSATRTYESSYASADVIAAALASARRLASCLAACSFAATDFIWDLQVTLVGKVLMRLPLVGRHLG